MSYCGEEFWIHGFMCVSLTLYLYDFIITVVEKYPILILSKIKKSKKSRYIR